MDPSTYRDELEEDFESFLDRLKFVSGPDSTLDQLRKVLAVQFSLNAANDSVRKHRQEVRRLEKEDPRSDRLKAYNAAMPRMNRAFSELLAAETDDYNRFKELVFRSLDILTTPAENEIELIDTIGGETLNEISQNFVTIRQFLESHVHRY